MPRIDKDLERRLAARRERERRRAPVERKYKFAPTSAETQVAEAEQAAPNGEARAALTETRAVAGDLGKTPRPARARGRNAPREFAEYREDYAYVGKDLRRILVVSIILAVIMAVLWLLLGQAP